MAFNPLMAEALDLTRSGDLLGATARIQAALGIGSPAAPPPAEPADGVIDLVADNGVWRAPDAAGSFTERSYRGAEGTMQYRLYRPARAAAGMPLIVMLHGCTQSAADFARGTGMNALAEEHGFLVAYPQQSKRANPQKCWNWFNPGDQRRDAGEPALLAAVTRAVMAEHGVDPARVYVAGLSAGGAAAAIMAARYPDLFAAAGIHSGLGCGAAQDLPGALQAMRTGGPATRPARFVPVITFHGDRDTIVHEVNSRRIVEAASAAAGTPLTVRTEAGTSPAGRRYTRALSLDGNGRVLIEQWTVAGGGHAWSGGDAAGSYTDPAGPDASRAMVRFFLTHRRG